MSEKEMAINLCERFLTSKGAISFIETVMELNGNDEPYFQTDDDYWKKVKIEINNIKE